MKLIDEKGRLFGKINIIDFMVVLFLLCFITTLYMGYKILTSHRLKEDVWVKLQVEFTALHPDISKVIKEGDAAKDEYGKINGKIDHISEPRASSAGLILLSGNKLATSASNSKELVADISIKCLKKQDSLYYNGLPVKIGKELAFSTDLYFVSGMIIGMRPEDVE